MTSTSIEGFLDFATAIAEDAAAMIRSTRPATICTKDNPADLVTDVDLALERLVRARIAAEYPDHAVDGEELGAPDQPADHTWYLDPIDGTTNYANGLPWSSFSLALADRDGPLVGVVADPFRGEIVAAARGRGAWARGRRLKASTAPHVAGTTVLMELEGHAPWPGMFDTVTGVSRAHGTVRIMGSSALSVVAVAAGRASAAVLGSSHPVDDMGGLLIAQEAGAVLLTRPGCSTGLCIAAPGVADQLQLLWCTP